MLSDFVNRSKQGQKIRELSMKIRAMNDKDLTNVAKVHAGAFPRHLHSEKWIACNFNAYPRIRYYVAEDEENILGYIQWTEKAGFRKEVVLDLEHIAVVDSRHRQGIGASLITQSLKIIKEELKQREATIKHILVSTRTDNAAQELYRKTLNAEPVAVIPNLYSADEVLMIARNPPV